MKFFTKTISTPHGKFDSKTEYEHFLLLLSRQEKGEIYGLRKQVRFVIIPKLMREEIIHLKTKIKVVMKVDELPAHYTCDFVYYDNRLGKYVMNEVKSTATAALDKAYPIRRKLIKRIIHEHNLKRDTWVFEESVYGKKRKKK